jgi:hypothetical protein
MTGRSALRTEIRMGWDGGDPWGSAISPAFDLCELLHWHLEEDVPAEAQFSPGLGVPDFEDYPQAEYVEMLDEGTITPDDLKYWVRVLSRYLDNVPEDRKY